MLSKYFNNSKEKADFGISLVVIILAGSLIGYFSFFGTAPSNQGGIKETLELNPQIDTLDLDGRTYIAVVPTNQDSQKSHPSQKQEELVITTQDLPHSTTQIDTFSSQENEEPLVKTEEKPAIHQEADNAIEAPDSTEIATLEETHDFDEVPNTEATPLTEVIDTIVSIDNPVEEVVQTYEKNTQPTLDKPTQNRDCIIVIGAFKNEGNIRNLIGKLDRDGYPIFKSIRNGTTRIGIYQDCTEVRTTLIKVRSKYTKDAFIMKAR